MWLPEAETLEAGPDGAEIDAALRSVRAEPAVFLLWPRSGSPYLGRTASLRRRLARLLGPGRESSRRLNLRGVVARVEYWRTGSRLESFLISWELARRHFPGTYRKLVKLRMPPYVKLILSRKFPRTQVTSRLTAARAQFFGPFRTRAAAERFENEFLDLFQIRRCREDFQPSPEHPGCIYGEMNRCLRPCQQVVSVEEYRSEVQRVSEFLATGGESLLRVVAAARDRLSEELNFEAAACQHEQYERIRQVLRLRDELATDIDRLNGVAVTPSRDNGAVELWFVAAGCWLPRRRFPLGVVEGRPVSLDKRLRELIASVDPAPVPLAERQEHLAILARWYYSSWRDGEWLGFDDFASVPYRKLVNAIHRVATGS